MSHFLSYCPTYFDDVVDVNLPVLVVVESVGDALQLVLWNALDLPHDADQLVDADEILPEGVEQTAYRERFVTRCSWRSGGENLKSTCCIQGSQITPIKRIFNFLHFVNFMLKNAA